MGKPDMQEYDYCEKHDIFFNPNPNPGEVGFGKCPLCLQNAFAGKPDPQRTLFEGSED